VEQDERVVNPRHSNPMRLIQIPCLTDNTAWLVADDAASHRPAFVVDPSEAAPVLARLDADGLRLEAVVLTHHHADHTGGTADLVAATGARVIGHAVDAARLPPLDVAALPGDVVTPIDGVQLRVLDVHAHTRAHVAYAMDRVIERVTRHGHDVAGIEVVDEDIARLARRPALFVGDTLFAAGCGRLFEVTPDDLHRALALLAAQDARALVCCAHEYTAANLRFAMHAFPDVVAIAARTAALHTEMGRARSSLPSTLEEELETNPFLLTLAQGVEALGAMRRAKDAFSS
jgi:hydroxyacylglutathione hydrolase